MALQIAIDVLMDFTIVHASASGDPRASHCLVKLAYIKYARRRKKEKKKKKIIAYSFT